MVEMDGTPTGTRRWVMAMNQAQFQAGLSQRGTSCGRRCRSFWRSTRRRPKSQGGDWHVGGRCSGRVGRKASGARCVNVGAIPGSGARGSTTNTAPAATRRQRWAAPCSRRRSCRWPQSPFWDIIRQRIDHRWVEAPVGARSGSLHRWTGRIRLVRRHRPCPHRARDRRRSCRHRSSGRALGQVLSNVKRSIGGAYHALKQRKYDRTTSLFGTRAATLAKLPTAW